MYKQPTKTTEPNNENKAYEYAVFLLCLKLRTVGELLKKMKNRGYGEMVIEKTIEKLKEQKYLDDQRYAEVFLENLKTYKNLGYYGIKKKFMEKNIPQALIESILAEGFTLADEIKVAKRFLKRLTPSSTILSASEESLEKENQYQTLNYSSRLERDFSIRVQQKLANRLKSRGFRGDVITKVLF